MLLMLLWERLEVTLYQCEQVLLLVTGFDQTVQIDGSSSSIVVVITAAAIAATGSSDRSDRDRRNN
jgi:hypothetical protein